MQLIRKALLIRALAQLVRLRVRGAWRCSGVVHHARIAAISIRYHLFEKIHDGRLTCDRRSLSHLVVKKDLIYVQNSGKQMRCAQRPRWN